MEGWIADHWFDLVQTVAILAMGLFNLAEYRSERTGRKMANLTELIKSHREIWTEYARNPALSRVKRSDVDLEREPVTREEATFVRFVIAHVFGAFQANRFNEIIAFGNAQADAGAFFSLPVPKAVWNSVRSTYEETFVDFIETERRPPPTMFT